MMRRGCCLGVIGVLGLCLVACVVGYVVGLPKFRHSVRDSLAEVVGTQIARQIVPASGVRVPPGTYVVDESDLNAGLRSEVDNTNLFDDVTVTLNPNGFVLRFTRDDNDVTYHGNVAAVDGRLAVTNMTGDGWLTNILPAGDVRKALENAVNNLLTTNNLRLTNAKLGDGTLTLTTKADSR
jgi:hypothetical protein